MKKLLLWFMGLTLLAVAPINLSQVAAQKAQADAGGVVAYDVAFDCRTFRNQDGINAGDFRGNTFILNGKIYPVRTIPPGDHTFSPDAAGSIGTFICRGTNLFDASDATATPPLVATTQIFRFDSNDGLVTEGLEAGISPVKRAVVGGWGKRFAGASGDVTLELLGFNNTDCENYRFTFRLK